MENEDEEEAIRTGDVFSPAKMNFGPYMYIGFSNEELVGHLMRWSSG